MMRLLMILVAVTLVAAKPPMKETINYKSLNGELDNILAMSKNINNMSPQELMQLSARVDGTLRKLELFAEKRLGLSKEDIDKINQAVAAPKAPKTKRQVPGGGEGAAPAPGLGPFSGGDGMGGLISLFSSMFSGMLPALQQMNPANNSPARAMDADKMAAPVQAHEH